MFFKESYFRKFWWWGGGQKRAVDRCTKASGTNSIILGSHLCEFMLRRSIDPNIDPFEAVLTYIFRCNPLQ